jgi:hypothetical protein
MIIISAYSEFYDFIVYFHIHRPFVQELIVGDTLKADEFFNNTLFKNKLLPLLYFPTIVTTPTGFFNDFKN